MRVFSRLAMATAIVAIAGAACSSGGGASSTQAGVSAGPAAASGSGATLLAMTVGSNGTILVAGSNGMTVYTFSNDTANSGKSACSGSCLTTWPAVTVAAGTQPTAGDGVPGKLGTITRDDGTLQVTYNGLPVYFFASDSKPGDTNGHYTNWNLVKP